MADLQVIGAGFGRTGTWSLKAALERLGVGPCFHMIDLREVPDRAPRFLAALNGEPADWDATFAGYSSSVDWPGCTFYKDLMAKYPDAKVILSERDPEKWYASAERTIYALKEAALRNALAEDRVVAPPEVLMMIKTLIWDHTFQDRFADKDFAIDVFNRHNENVKRTVPADKLLVYEIQQGWEPLCELLGVDVPDEEFPHLNDAETFRQMFGIPAGV
ncbi:MAG TPA: sulfotransferase [Conexibacter sp.]|nr:sulfotransferase [Conexibacter sp.]